MKSVTGQILRMCGLLIELGGAWAVLTGKGNDEKFKISLPDGGAISVAWLAVGVGFVIWLAGRIMISMSRPPRRRIGRSSQELEWLGQTGEEVVKPEQPDDEIAS
jgi:hypothetical protein